MPQDCSDVNKAIENHFTEKRMIELGHRLERIRACTRAELSDPSIEGRNLEYGRPVVQSSNYLESRWNEDETCRQRHQQPEESMAQNLLII